MRLAVFIGSKRHEMESGCRSYRIALEEGCRSSTAVNDRYIRIVLEKTMLPVILFSNKIRMN